jgi:hypothetical protein
MSGSSASPMFSSAGQGTTGAMGGTGTSAPPCSPASPSGGPYCLTFVGTSFDVHVGQQFKVALLSSNSGAPLTDPTNNTFTAHWEFFTLPSATFWVNLPQSMVAGTSYYIGYYADNNHNGMCDLPIANGSSDHVYRSYTQLVPFNNAAGTITTIQTTTTQGDFTWVTMHSDPWIDDPTGQDTCTPLNKF